MQIERGNVLPLRRARERSDAHGRGVDVEPGAEDELSQLALRARSHPPELDDLARRLELHPQLRALARRLARTLVWHGPEDLLQGALERVIRGIASYRGVGDVIGWTARIMRNAQVEWMRRESHESSKLGGYALEVADRCQDDPSDVVADDELRDAVQHVWQRSRDDRDVQLFWDRVYLSGDMRELTSHSETTTEFDPDTRPVSIAGITLDVRGQSPIHSEATTRAVARRGDPEWGMVRLESVSTTADGQVIKTQYSLKLPSPDAPIVIGPVGGGEMSLPPRAQTVAGKDLVFRSAPRLTEIRALLVAPTFDDLLAGSELREVRVPGTRVETGSMRVLTSDGTPIGYYAGDVRVLRNEEYVAQK